MTGPDIANIPLTQTAYGGREAKYVVHYKFFGESTDAVKVPLRDVSVALDQAGLPCKGFYNYANREFPCAASSGDAWLEAHFSDVSRMRSIKENEDPNNRFVSELKAKVWGFATGGNSEPQTGSPTIAPAASPTNQTMAFTSAPPTPAGAETASSGTPVTCTAITDGAFGNAGKESLLLLNEETDCLVPGTGWHDYPHTENARLEPSFAEICVSLDNSTRYIFSNGLPDHTIFSPSDRPKHCVVPFAAAMPYAPVYNGSYLEENPVAGPIGFALNGVPFVDATWAVDNGYLFEDAAWTGHANSAEFWWHYHSSRMPPNGEYAGEEELVGYAMDGFPIYGPTNDVLDECNGRLVDGTGYRYHQVKMEDIDFTRPQCNEDDPRVHNWNPIIGCFRGSTAQSRVYLDDGNRQGMFCSPSGSTAGTPTLPSPPSPTIPSPPTIQPTSLSSTAGTPILPPPPPPSPTIPSPPTIQPTSLSSTAGTPILPPPPPPSPMIPSPPTIQPTSLLYVGGATPLGETSGGATRHARKLVGVFSILVVLITLP